MTVILLKIKVIGNCLHQLSMNCVWRYDQLSHAFLLMIFQIIAIIIALSSVWSLLHVSTRMSNKGKRKAEVRVYLMISKRHHMRKSAKKTRASMAAVLSYVLQCPAKKVQICLQTAAPEACVGGSGCPPTLTVPYIQLPRSLLRQLPSILFLPPSSFCNKDAHWVFFTLSLP